MRRAAPLLLVLLSGLALTACGQQTGPPASPARPTSSDDPGFQPLDAYDMSEGDVDTVGRAQWTRAKECMVRLGFAGLRNLDIDPVPGWPQRPAEPGVFASIAFSSDELRYGVQDPGQAARHGYRYAQAEYERDHPSKKWNLSEHLALTGQFIGDDPKSVHGHRIPERGCLGEADRAIYGTNPQDRTDPVLSLEGSSLRTGMRDPVWKKADKAWSACMRTAGYRYATPDDAESGRDRLDDQLEEQARNPDYDPDQPSALEKKTATADARCKQRTGYVRTVHAVDIRIQNQLIAKNRAKLDEQLRLNREAVGKAQDILEDRS